MNDIKWLRIGYLNYLEDGDNLSKELCDKLIGKVDKRMYESVTSFIKALLVSCYRGDDGVIVSLAKTFYTNDSNFITVNGAKVRSKVNYAAVKKVTDCLCISGYLTHHKGFSVKKFNRSQPGYVIFEQPFKDLMKNVIVKKTKENKNYLILRGEGKVDLEFEQTEETKEIIELLARYEYFMEIYTVQIHGTRINPYLCRIFYENFHQQGRLYARGSKETFQTLPSGVRKDITIDNFECVELDYKALHPSMLYEMENIDLYGIDIYRSAGIDVDLVVDENQLAFDWDLEPGKRLRKFLKLVFMIILNTDSRESSIKAIINKLKEDSEKTDILYREYIGIRNDKKVVEYVIDKIIENNKGIEKYFFTGVYNKLQYNDSEMMVKILDLCIEADIPVLPVHDSVICTKGSYLEVKDIMEKAYQYIFGSKMNCHVEVK